MTRRRSARRAFREARIEDDPRCSAAIAAAAPVRGGMRTPCPFRRACATPWTARAAPRADPDGDPARPAPAGDAVTRLAGGGGGNSGAGHGAAAEVAIPRAAVPAPAAAPRRLLPRRRAWRPSAASSPASWSTSVSSSEGELRRSGTKAHSVLGVVGAPNAHRRAERATAAFLASLLKGSYVTPTTAPALLALAHSFPEPRRTGGA